MPARISRAVGAQPAQGASRLLLPAGLARPIRLTDAEEVGEGLARVTRGWAFAPAETGTPCASVTADAAGYTVDSDWVEAPATGLTATEAVCSLGVDLALGLLEADPGRIALHCGAVEIGGRLVVVSGAQRSGKSTLIGRLSAEAVRVFCDDILPIGGPGDDGMALGFAPRLRLPPPPRAGAGFRAHVEATCALEDGHYGYLVTDNLAPHGATAPIGAFLLLDRRRHGRARLRAAAGRAEAMRFLLQRNLTEDRDPQPLIARLDALMDRAPVMWLEYSDLDEAAGLILSAFADGAGPPAVLPAHAPRPPRHDRRPAGTRAPAPTARFRPRPGISARSIDGELFLSDDAERAILHLDPVGAAVWTLIEDGGASAAEAAELLQAAFPEVPPAQIAGDVARLLSELDDAGLLRPAS